MNAAFCRLRFAALFSLCGIALPGDGAGIDLNVGDDFASVMRDAPQGSTFLVKAGIHRLQSFTVPSNSMVIGEPGAVLSGAVVVDQWESAGLSWISTQIFAPVATPRNSTACGSTDCIATQHLFVDERRIPRVWDRQQLNGQSWYFDEAAGRVILSFSPVNRLVEFEVGPQTCIGGGDGGALGSNVVYRGLRIEKYACPVLVGSVTLGKNSVAEDCEVAWSSAIGIYMGAGSRATRCLSRNNGQDGIAALGTGIVVEDCELYGNAWGGFSFSFQESGMKCSGAVNGTIRRNYFHDNHAPGLWLDIESRQNLIADNISEHNEEDGIILEIGCNNTVNRNVCRWNGWGNLKGPAWGGQIEIQNSSGCEVAHNYMEPSAVDGERQNALMIINQPHRGAGPNCGEHSTRGNLVHDNLIVAPKGMNIGHNYGSLSFGSYEGFLAAGNSFYGNRYVTARPNQMLFYTFLPDDGWPEPYASGWVLFPKWRDQGKDVDSEPVHLSRDRIARTSRELIAMISEHVGFDYEAEKLRRIWRRSTDLADDNGDGLPNFWNREFKSVVLSGAQGDSDEDGLSNIEEWAQGTDPTKADTDGDELPDGWEVDAGLDPLHHDAQGDIDGDDVSNVLEFTDGSPPTVATTGARLFPEEGLSCWLSAAYNANVQPGGMMVWTDRSEFHRATYPGAITVKGSAEGLPLALQGSSASYQIWSPNATGLWNPVNDGADDHPFTICIVLRCPAVPMDYFSRGLFTSEGGGGGLRMTVLDGVVTAQSVQAGGTLILSSHRRLGVNETVMLTLCYGGKAGRSALYVNGDEVDHIQDRRIRIGGSFVLGGVGGMTDMPSAWSEALIYNRALTGIELRNLHSFFGTRYFNRPVENPGDLDADGVPDDFETSHGTDITLPDGLRDADGDGLVNRREYEVGLNPGDAFEDTDSDGIADAWEVFNDLQVGMDDSLGDADGDGVSNIMEYRDKTSPVIAQPFFTGLQLDSLDFWLQAGSGVETVGADLVNSWHDRSVRSLEAIVQSDAHKPRLVEVDGKAFVRWEDDATALTVDEWVQGSVGDAIPFTVLMRCRFNALPDHDVVLLKNGNSSGFELGLQSGHPVVRSLGGDWMVVHPQVVATGSLVTIALTQRSGNTPPSLYLNDLPADALTGVKINKGEGGFALTACTGFELAEFMLFREALTERERLRVHYAFVNEGTAINAGATDADFDGLPDWWELLSGSDPNFGDASSDPDYDGITNSQAFGLRRLGFDWIDRDHDGMHDGWEAHHGLNLEIDDAHSDPDGDGVDNFAEFTVQSDPRVAASFQSEVSFGASSPQSLMFRFNRNRHAWDSAIAVEESRDLVPASWTTLASGSELSASAASDDGFTVVEINPRVAASQRRFFRLRISRRF